MRELTPVERRAALMRAAGATLAAIGQFLGSEEQHVKDILHRPHVLSFMGFLNATDCESLTPSVEKLNEAIETTAARAFVVARDNMEDLHEMGEDLRGADDRTAVRAKLGAVATAQDILDRAGKRAPTRIIGGVVHTVDPTALDHLASVVERIGERSEQKQIAETIEVIPEREGDPGDQQAAPAAGHREGRA